MKWLAALALMGMAAAQAAVTVHDVAKFLEERASMARESPDTDEAAIYSVVSSAPQDASLAAAAQRLAARWAVSETAAAKIIEAAIVQQTAPWVFGQTYDDRFKPAAALYRAAVDAAPQSPRIWNVALDFWAGEGGACLDDSLRDEYLQKNFGAAEFVRMGHCENWLPAVVKTYPRSLAARFELVEYLRHRDSAAALAASRSLLDILEAADARGQDAELVALRRHWMLLGGDGLYEELLADAAARPPERLAALLEREPLAQGVEGDEQRPASTGKEERAAARSAWLYSLLAGGRIDEARAVDAKYGDAVSHDVLRGAHVGDLFDDYIADGNRYAPDGKVGLLWNVLGRSALEKRALAKFFTANRFGSAARMLEANACDRYRYSEERDERDEPQLRALPGDFGAHRERYTRLLAQLDEQAGCTPGGRKAETSSRLVRFAEVPMSEAQKALPILPQYPGKIPLPASFERVRAERRGDDIAAICLSSAVDPGGEVSRGGYWLLRSKDGGRNWLAPLYLGFQMHQPYEVHSEARLSLFAGDALRIETDVKELDPRSVTFPPVALRSRREAQDLYIDLPLAALEKDGDGDGFPDVLEARLRTDPANPDTDGDGFSDRLDDFPQVSARAEPHPLAPIVADMLKRLTGFERAGIIEPLPDGKPGARDALLRDRRRAGAGSYLFRFIVGDPRMFAGLGIDGQVIVLGEADVAELAARYGPFYPVHFPEILLDPKGERALVNWGAGWIGGTILYQRKNGRWVGKEVSSWITRVPARPALATSTPSTSPG